jgi:hypothetical protein
MIQIKRMSNEDGIHCFEFVNSVNIHNQLINFLYMLGFCDDALTKIDTPFSELDGVYIFVKKKGMKIHFFVYNNKTQMIIDSRLSQKKITELIKKYFIFPK